MTLKLKELLAFLTVQVIVLRVAIIVLVDCPACQLKFTSQARVDQFIERAVDGGTTDIACFALAG